MMKRYIFEGTLLFFTVCGIILYTLGFDDIIRLTPVYIAMNVGLLLAVFRSNTVVRALSIAFIVGYLAEAIGVHTGLLFGDYQYGTVLGPKLADVPIIVGVLWGLVMVVLWSVFDDVQGSKKLLYVALGAVLYDVALEHFAVRFGLWSWEGGIPLSNALGWMLVATLIGLVFDWYGIRLPRKMFALVILPLHTLFFVALMALA